MTPKFAIYDTIKTLVFSKSNDRKSMIHLGWMPDYVSYLAMQFNSMHGSIVIPSKSEYNKHKYSLQKFDFYNWEIGEDEISGEGVDVRRYSFSQKFSIVSIAYGEKSLLVLKQIDIKHKPVVIIEYDVFTSDSIDKICEYLYPLGLSLMLQSDYFLVFIPI